MTRLRPEASRAGDPRRHSRRGARRRSAGSPFPTTTAASPCTRTRPTCSRACRPRDKDPRKSLHLDEVPTPELGPGEAIVAVMASAINYNTVWTSIFEPMSTFGFLRRYGRISPLAKRHDLPYHVVGSDLAGVVLRTGPGVNAWKPGDRVVAHCLSVELESPDGHGDTMMDPEQRIWGFETNFGGLAELALVKSNQLMPKPAPPDLGGGGQPRAGQLHRLPPAGLPQRRRHEAGRHRADLGRVRRPRLLRHPVRAQRRGDPGLRGLLAGEGGDLPADGRRADHRPERRGLPVLARRAQPGPEGVEAVRRPGSASSPAARTRTSSSSTPAGRRSAPASTSPARAARS